MAIGVTKKASAFADAFGKFRRVQNSLAAAGMSVAAIATMAASAAIAVPVGAAVRAALSAAITALLTAALTAAASVAATTFAASVAAASAAVAATTVAVASAVCVAVALLFFFGGFFGSEEKVFEPFEKAFRFFRFVLVFDFPDHFAAFAAACAFAAEFKIFRTFAFRSFGFRGTGFGTENFSFLASPVRSFPALRFSGVFRRRQDVQFRFFRRLFGDGGLFGLFGGRRCFGACFGGSGRRRFDGSLLRFGGSLGHFGIRRRFFGGRERIPVFTLGAYDLDGAARFVVFGGLSGIVSGSGRGAAFAARKSGTTAGSEACGALFHSGRFWGLGVLGRSAGRVVV